MAPLLHHTSRHQTLSSVFSLVARFRCFLTFAQNRFFGGSGCIYDVFRQVIPDTGASGGVVGSCLCSITVDVSNVIISPALATAPLAATLVISYYHYHV